MRTNKTYSTSDDGTSFFSFQSTSFNSFGDSKSDEEIDEAIDQDDEGAKDTVSDNDTPPKEYEDDEEQREEIEDNVGVDEGLFNA